jgi:hypothetical protein
MAIDCLVLAAEYPYPFARPEQSDRDRIPGSTGRSVLQLFGRPAGARSAAQPLLCIRVPLPPSMDGTQCHAQQACIWA